MYLESDVAMPRAGPLKPVRQSPAVGPSTIFHYASDGERAGPVPPALETANLAGRGGRSGRKQSRLPRLVGNRCVADRNRGTVSRSEPGAQPVNLSPHAGLRCSAPGLRT